MCPVFASNQNTHRSAASCWQFVFQHFFSVFVVRPPWLKLFSFEVKFFLEKSWIISLKVYANFISSLCWLFHFGVFSSKLNYPIFIVLRYSGTRVLPLNFSLLQWKSDFGLKLQKSATYRSNIVLFIFVSKFFLIIIITSIVWWNPPRIRELGFGHFEFFFFTYRLPVTVADGSESRITRCFHCFLPQCSCSHFIRWIWQFLTQIWSLDTVESKLDTSYMYSVYFVRFYPFNGDIAPVQ